MIVAAFCLASALLALAGAPADAKAADRDARDPRAGDVAPARVVQLLNVTWEE